ncbi:hypothetical protein IMZ08_14085 [Bacillus luteolus]|uniref:Uncharacterized protein n=1 Tax=Litchfieldia luteola TaxID=682179 RepID=A0ABR9QL15_9BACI|nr:hypothetical protein [Cytobacillus luteolus]MBE4909192.1 hypothetical protein [Cytobacillus luteolus]MBP1940355.1 hypothetical protein [Cytobacillus luteolus]
MNLIDTYIYEVTRRLPEKTREDIAMELRSTIEDMLPEKYTEENVIEQLEKLGNPAVLAASYRETPNYLIGPKVYDAYIHTIKRIIPWAILVTILVHVVESIVRFTGEQAILDVMIGTFANIVPSILMTLIQLFFWVTIVFIVIERVGLSKTDLPLTKNGVSWSPRDLKNIIIIPRKKLISKGEIIFSFIWIVLWALVYFNADHLVGIYQSINGDGLQFIMPILNQEVLLSYWPIIVAFIALEIGLILYKLKVGQWTYSVAWLNAIIHVASIFTFFIIASNPNLYNSEIIPYFADIIETNAISVENTIKWIWWSMIITFVVTIAIEIYDTFRKARM